MVADDLNGVLVCANRSVGTKSEELAGDCAFRRGVDLAANGEGRICHVVHNANGEMILRLLLFEIRIDRVHHGWREFLATEAVASADDFNVPIAGFHQRVDHVLIQRFAEGAGFLRAVEYGEALHRLWQGFDKFRRNEWAIQANL